VGIDGAALDQIVMRTLGYPYFLQEWGAHAWNLAARSPITVADVERASGAAITDLDRSFLRVRFDRLQRREQDYLRAMAGIGPGPHRSGAFAERLGTLVERIGALREGLIRKGMIYSPRRGETAFTVPLFDAFMRRSLPDWTPEAAASRRSPRTRSRKRRTGTSAPSD
jgi:hypothetical protein